jgi:CheY-like chemotaxis protein/HPt (histidine-containing phosphotransfer) domain-containing protein
LAAESDADTFVPTMGIQDGEMPLRLMIVDDDEVSREVLSMLAEGEGYLVTAVEDGDAALAWLERADALVPDAILTDLQMPGTSGTALAKALRSACGPETLLLAMSGSGPKADDAAGYDGFLLKPLTMGNLAEAISRRHSVNIKAPVVDDVNVFDWATYDLLKQSMGKEQLGKLFELCMSDAGKRIGVMRQALTDDDEEAYQRAAHAIKGGCGMVGATELYGIASEMEIAGLDGTSLDTLDRFVAASARLQRMLLAHEA